MYKIFYILSLLSVQLLASHYSNTIIDIESKLFPKIALLEEQIKQDKSKYLTIIIVANETDDYIAQEFKEKLLFYYPNEISGKKLTISIRNLNKIRNKKPDAIIVLNHTPKELKKIALWANTHRILSFSYDTYALEYGIVASIHIGRSIKPYFNSNPIKKYGFIFDSYLLNLSKFIK